MTIEYIKGPYAGIIEEVVEETEDHGIPVYITESGKALSNNDLNRVFKIKPSKPNLNFAELGDPSLVSNEVDFIESTKNKGIASEHMEVIQHKETVTTSISTSNPLLDSLLKKAKLTNVDLNVSINIDIPNTNFFDLLSTAIDISGTEYINSILDKIDKQILIDAIKKSLFSYYNIEIRDIEDNISTTNTKEDE